MLSRCIITYADYNKRGELTYHELALRQQQSITKDAHLLFTPKDKLPRHSDNLYAFKAHAIEYARNLGHELIIWCDSPIVQTKPLDRLWEWIEEKGYIFFDNAGYNNSQWSTDRMMNYFGSDREEAENMKHIMACCFGLNFENKQAAHFQDMYFEAANAEYWGKPLFKESWDNSRHDQTAASYILYILDMDITVPHDTFFTYDNEEHRKAYGPVKDSVCLMSR